MRILFKILAVVFAISLLGNVIVGKIFIVGIILTTIFTYFGWKPKTVDIIPKTVKPNPITKEHQELSDFQVSFSDQQKGAMLYSLMLLVSSEGDYDNNKFAFVDKQAGILKFDLEGESMAVYEQKNADYAYGILKTLNNSQKEWFSIALASIITLNGRTTENERSLANRILTESNISNEQFKNVNQKAQALFNRFNL